MVSCFQPSCWGRSTPWILRNNYGSTGYQGLSVWRRWDGEGRPPAAGPKSPTLVGEASHNHEIIFIKRQSTEYYCSQS